MRKLNLHGGLTPAPFKGGDRVKYIGDGTSVASGSYGYVMTVYENQVEVKFDNGTLLVTEFGNVEKAARYIGVGRWDGR